jgi:hypothetical protein
MYMAVRVSVLSVDLTPTYVYGHHTVIDVA